MARALLGVERIHHRNRPSFLPRKALRNPRKSHQALQGAQSLHRPIKRLQIAPFQLSAPLGHLRSDRASLCPFRPKYPVFQHFLDRKVYPPRDFRDQFPDFARLSCIGKGLPKNMARILRGVKSPFASSAGGGGLFPCTVVWSPPSSALPLPCGLCPLLPACGLPWGIFDYGHFSRF